MNPVRSSEALIAGLRGDVLKIFGDRKANLDFAAWLDLLAGERDRKRGLDQEQRNQTGYQKAHCS